LNTILTEENAAPHEANSASAAGTIFGIERFSTRDGPGIRTTVFLKGCPLNCAWCHNPEGIGRQKAISFAAEFCIACGACAGVCQHGAHQLLAAESGQPALHLYDRSQCDACGSCVQDCPAGALEVVGRVTTVDEVMREVMQDRVFYARSGGGLTLSGGEPTAQIGFAVALLASAKREGLHWSISFSSTSKSPIRGGTWTMWVNRTKSSCATSGRFMIMVRTSSFSAPSCPATTTAKTTCKPSSLLPGRCLVSRELRFCHFIHWGHPSCSALVCSKEQID